MWDNLKFLFRTALKDSRRDRAKLFMFMSSIILGVAALVAINSFNYNLVNDIDKQTASLIGADLAVTSNKVIAPEVLDLVEEIPGEDAEEWSLLSMAYLPKVDESQFVRLKALKGDYPFYGEVKTEPEGVIKSLDLKPMAIVDQSLMLQKQLEVGDEIRLGEKAFTIGGVLTGAFGGAALAGGFAPTVYISLDFIDETKLVQPGSLVNYALYYKTDQAFDLEEWLTSNKKIFQEHATRTETIKERKEGLNRAFGALNDFLNLVALVSLLLGCIGVASSVFIYVKRKVRSIAVLRCLGMSGQQAMGVYFIQIFILGLISVILGVIGGSLIQTILPTVFADFLPLEVSLSLSWRAIFEGFVIGTVITSLFALLPLVSIRRISPLRTLRSDYQEDIDGQDYLRTGIIGAIAIVIFLFLWILTRSLMDAAIFFGGLAAAFLALFLMSQFVMWAAKKFFPRNWSFIWRQGISNLFRPNNQTRTLMISLGLGTAVLTSLLITQSILLNNVSQMDAGEQPNILLYGIEINQSEDLATLTRESGLPVSMQVPIVTMRLAEWQGRTKSQWLADSSRKAKRWAINREIRASYRDSLDGYEILTEGKFRGRVENPGDSIFISMSGDYAEDLDVGLGDEIVFNVQGTRMVTYISSLRQIEYTNLRPRFFIVFPAGVLEAAPQFKIMVSKSPDAETTAKYRNAVVKQFPNVSVIDLGSILKAVSDIFSKVNYVVKFLAAFCILTGIIVLISSLLLSKYQRIKESVLFRTLGASRRQVLMINGVEYLLIGMLSSLTGIVIAILLSLGLASLQMELDFSVDWISVFAVFFGITALTVLIGLFNTRDVVRKSPLEILRS